MSVRIAGSMLGGGETSKVASAKLELDGQAFSRISERMQKGLIAMAYGVRERAMFRAPVLTGTLYNTIRVEPPTDDGVEIAAGGKFGTGMDGKTRYVGYAYVREKSNFAHPEKAHYMENALQDVFDSDYQHQYFKGVL